MKAYDANRVIVTNKDKAWLYLGHFKKIIVSLGATYKVYKENVHIYIPWSNNKEQAVGYLSNPEFQLVKDLGTTCEDAQLKRSMYLKNKKDAITTDEVHMNIKLGSFGTIRKVLNTTPITIYWQRG